MKKIKINPIDVIEKLSVCVWANTRYFVQMEFELNVDFIVKKAFKALNINVIEYIRDDEHDGELVVFVFLYSELQPYPELFERYAGLGHGMKMYNPKK